MGEHNAQDDGGDGLPSKEDSVKRTAFFVTNLLWILSFGLFSLPVSAAWNKAALNKQAARYNQQLPTVKGRNLANEVKTYPTAFPGSLTVVYLGFKRRHQKDFKAWNKAVFSLCRRYKGLDYTKIPVMGGFAGLFRYFILRGMRKMFPARRQQIRWAPLFVAQSRYRKPLKIASDKDMVLLLTDRSGRVYWKASGTWNKAAAKQLSALLKKLFVSASPVKKK